MLRTILLMLLCCCFIADAAVVQMDAAEYDRDGNPIVSSVYAEYDNRGNEAVTGVSFEIRIASGDPAGGAGYLLTDPDCPWYGLDRPQGWQWHEGDQCYYSSNALLTGTKVEPMFDKILDLVVGAGHEVLPPGTIPSNTLWVYSYAILDVKFFASPAYGDFVDQAGITQVVDYDPLPQLVIPEPTICVLLAIGGLCLCKRR